METSLPRCDILLFVTTATEREQLEQAATDLALTFQTHDSVLGEYFDLGYIGDARVLGVKTRAGAFRYGGAAATAVRFKAETRATGMIAVGMAFGAHPTTQSLGDILVATHILAYDHRRKVREGASTVTEYLAKPRRAKESLLRSMERHVGDRRDVHFGALLSGGAKIECPEYRDRLVNAFPSDKRLGVPVGGDMEGAELMAASDPEDPSWLVVKGISDFADDNQQADATASRELACGNAIRFVLGALLRKIDSEES